MGEEVFHMPQTKSFLNSLQISEQAKEAIQDTSDQNDYVATLEEIDIVLHKSNPNKVFVTLSVNDKEEHFQLYTGATVNVMSDIIVSKLCGNTDHIKSCITTLLMYNKAEVKPIGRKKMRVLNVKNNNMFTVEFIVVKGQCKSILELKTSKYFTSYSKIDKYTRLVRKKILSTATQIFSKVKESSKANCTWN